MIVMSGEESIFSGEIPVNTVMAWAYKDNVPDRVLRDGFISDLKKNGWNEKCNEKIREIGSDDGLYLATCFIFHIEVGRHIDLDNIVKFYIDAIFQAAYSDMKKAQDRPDWKVNKIIAQKDMSEKNKNNERIELKISINDGALSDCKKL